MITASDAMHDNKSSSQIVWRGQKAASLIPLLIALGILGIVAYSFIQSQHSLQFSQRQHQAIMAAKDIEQVILTTIIKKQIDYINTDRCNSNIKNYFNNMTVGSNITIKPKPPVFKALDRLTVIPAPSNASSDVRRCNSTKSFEGYNAAESKSHYHCLMVETSVVPATASRHTFAANLGAFIEVFVQIKNLGTNTALTCSKAAVKNVNGTKENLGNGIEVFYNLHWTIPDAVGNILYKSKVGSVRVAL